ncbi:MAG: CpsD/CapB family tyrosine-protein kinase [Planctomycetes bacterium]|nr:CpsD/CapB family tyrosine-protein kinase [Planctomycetota bacterium]
MTPPRADGRRWWMPPWGGRERLAGPYRRVAIQLHYDLLEAGAGRSVLLVDVDDPTVSARSSVLLARCCAEELGRSVLLIDACPGAPVASRQAGCQGRGGFTDLLQDPSRTLADLVLATDVPGVSLLGAGAGASRGAPPERLGGIVRAAEEAFGLVVLCGGAVLRDECSALALAPHAGCVLLSVVEGATRIRDMEAAQEALALCRPPRVGLLLTARPRARDAALRASPNGAGRG